METIQSSVHFFTGVAITLFLMLIAHIVGTMGSMPTPNSEPKPKIKKIMKKIDEELVGLHDYSYFYITVPGLSRYSLLSDEKKQRLRKYYDERRVTAFVTPNDRFLVILFPVMGVDIQNEIVQRLVFLTRIEGLNKCLIHAVPGCIALNLETREMLMKDHRIRVMRMRTQEDGARTDIEFTRE